MYIIKILSKFLQQKSVFNVLHFTMFDRIGDEIFKS